MGGDVYDEDGKKIIESHREEFAETLERLLSEHPNMWKNIGYLIQQIHERDLINRNRHKKGDDIARRVVLNEELKERAIAFCKGMYDEKKSSPKRLDQKEFDSWIKRGQEYKAELEKLPESKRKEIQATTAQNMFVIIVDRMTLLDKHGNPPPYGD